MAKLKTGIYQHLPDDEKAAYLEARRRINAHVDSLAELGRHEQRFGESREVEALKTKAVTLREEAEAAFELLCLRLNTEYAHLSAAVRGKGKPRESGG